MTEISSEFRQIVSITERVLGSSHRGVNTDGWTEYNCPHCAEMEGVETDNKYNLCINYAENYYHCWKCQNSGKISKLIKRYGTREDLDEYYAEASSLKNYQSFQLTVGDKKTSYEDEQVELPKEYKPLRHSDRYAQRAYDYLWKRGIKDKFINRYHIGYIGYVKDRESDEYKLRNRIIIPSYNAYGNLNYWIARDYSGKTSLKYLNPKVEKKTIVFNESLINWYEDVTLVEGVFDHMVIPNSIPLLGKSLSTDSAIYDIITKKAQANVNILLDDDALSEAFKLYELLNNGVRILRGKVRVLPCPNGYDASLVFEKFGKKGVSMLFKQAITPSDFQMLWM